MGSDQREARGGLWAYCTRKGLFCVQAEGRVVASSHREAVELARKKVRGTVSRHVRVRVWLEDQRSNLGGA